MDDESVPNSGIDENKVMNLMRMQLLGLTEIARYIFCTDMDDPLTNDFLPIAHELSKKLLDEVFVTWI